jgi:hypothetical protein
MLYPVGGRVYGKRPYGKRTDSGSVIRYDRYAISDLKPICSMTDTIPRID